MPKYRLLDSEELEAFENEFIEFLVLNSITADDWVKIKDTNTVKALKFIELFSDVIFEKLMRQTQYIMKRDRNNIAAFHFQENQAVVVAMECLDGNIDLRSLTNFDTLSEETFKIYPANKVYDKQREIEMFALIKSGAEVSDGAIYKALCLELK